jgi:hypothetical protein
MANLQNAQINDTGFLVLPAPVFNTSAQAQIRYNPTTNTIESFSPVEAGQFGQGTWRASSIPYFSRQIITTGYQHGGYQTNVVFNTSNRTIFATDTTVDLTGTDQKQEAGHNYQSQACNKTFSFTWGASGSHCVAASNVICFNMRTEVRRTSGYTRSWPFAHINNGTVQQEWYKAWITSTYGSSATYEFDLVTETLGSNYGNNTGGQNWASSHENLGIFYGNGERNWYFATRTMTTRSGTLVAGDGLQHTMQFKQGMHLAGREGNPSTNWRQTDMVTNISRDVLGAKPAYSGEENFSVGQDWGYCLGFYNGNHVNTTYKMIYSTSTGQTMGSATEPKGNGGNSSATNSWRD